MNAPTMSACRLASFATADAPEPPRLLLDVARCGPVVVVRVAGEIDLATAPALRTVLRRQTEAATPLRRIDVDLAQVTFLDATGLGVLVEARQRGHRAGANLVVRNAYGIVRRVFVVTGLADCFGLTG